MDKNLARYGPYGLVNKRTLKNQRFYKSSTNSGRYPGLSVIHPYILNKKDGENSVNAIFFPVNYYFFF